MVRYEGRGSGCLECFLISLAGLGLHFEQGFEQGQLYHGIGLELADCGGVVTSRLGQGWSRKNIRTVRIDY